MENQKLAENEMGVIWINDEDECIYVSHCCATITFEKSEFVDFAKMVADAKIIL